VSDQINDGGPAQITQLNMEQVSILEHTVNLAPSGRYCGNSKTMQSLVDIGYMRSIGFVAWCDDEFFTITNEGRLALSSRKEAPRE
jgi:hypothetical protein